MFAPIADVKGHLAVALGMYGRSWRNRISAYSYRSARIGSICDARRAGRKPAASATSTRTTIQFLSGRAALIDVSYNRRRRGARIRPERTPALTF